MKTQKNKKINSTIQRMAVELKCQNQNLTTMQIAEKIHETMNNYSLSTIYNYCKPGNIEYYKEFIRERQRYTEMKKMIRESREEDLFAFLLRKCEILENRIRELEIFIYEDRSS